GGVARVWVWRARCKPAADGGDRRQANEASVSQQSPHALFPAFVNADNRLCGAVLLIRHTSLPWPAVPTPAAAASRCQQAAARVSVTRCSAGSSLRQRSSANGQRGLKGQP